MKNFLDVLVNKVFNAKPKQKTFEPVAKPKYDFVEQYTIVDPKKVFYGGYDSWVGCENIPVVCEEHYKTPNGVGYYAELPAKIVMGFLMELQRKSAAEIENPKMRTLSIIHISKHHRVIIGPNFYSPKFPVFWVITDDADRKDWVFYVTPEINRAIVDALKIHTR